MSADDGAGGQAVTSYTYEGARAQLRGRGFLGFAAMEATDAVTGVVTRTEFRQDYPFTGQVAASESYLPDAAGPIRINRLSNTWTSRPLNGGLTVFPYASQAVAESFEINDGPEVP